nr:RNA exonuclease 4 [Tanacetum cinerariifolium]
NKCAACYRQFNRKEHLVEHMKTSYHSVHEPMCGYCGKRCRSLKSLREHLIGPLPKAECERVVLSHRFASLGIQDDLRIDSGKTRAVALACKMVGGGSDGSLDLCAKVCIIDEYENILFRSYVKPHLPVTHYRHETTGIRPEYLRDAMPLRQVQRKIQEFLCNWEPIWKIRPRGGKARILVGHGLDHDLRCLELEDTATYPPLMKTSKLSNSLKYLTRAYLGYDIQSGIQDPYDDCVATMRLYRRMRSQYHRNENYPLATDPQNKNNFASWRQSELERMSPDELLTISRSDFYCWCLDSKDHA